MIPVHQQHDWEMRFIERISGTLNRLLKGGPFSVIIFNKGIGGHFQVKEGEKIIFTHQGKNIPSHWKELARKALVTIWENEIA
jgi:hypothetical protein